MLKRLLQTEITNRRRYGRGAPRYAARIYVNPAEIGRYVRKRTTVEGELLKISELSGTVTEREFWHEAADLYSYPPIACGLRRFRDGLSWEDSGEVARMLAEIEANPRGHVSDCRTREDVLSRCRALDEVFEQIRTEGELRESYRAPLVRREGIKGMLRRRLHRMAPSREWHGVLVHLGQDGELIFGGEGDHRLAMALSLGLTTIPAKVGLVHLSALSAYRELSSRSRS